MSRKPLNDLWNCGIASIKRDIHSYAQWAGSPQMTLRGFTTLIWIQSKSDPKGVKLWFRYDQPPSEFGFEPIKRVATAMFSLVRIRPMFEQEAPKWPWGLQLDSNTIMSRTKRVKLDSDTVSPLLVILNNENNNDIWSLKRKRTEVLLYYLS